MKALHLSLWHPKGAILRAMEADPEEEAGIIKAFVESTKLTRPEPGSEVRVRFVNPAFKVPAVLMQMCVDYGLHLVMQDHTADKETS